MKLAQEFKSLDGSVKSLWEVSGGVSVESVRFRLGQRSHICISCQAGCNLACRFCETGRQKNLHDLDPEQIVAQVAATLPPGAHYDVVQFAGMGEPLLNLEAVRLAIGLLRARRLTREVTLTTAGIVPSIASLAALALDRLNISLHAADDQTRSRILPINRKYPISRLMEAVAQLQDACGIPVTYNYLLFDGVNDRDADLERLVALLANGGRQGSIRLKAWNPIENTGLLPSPRSRFEYFEAGLRQAGHDVTLCESMGSDVGGGCGQLRSLQRALVQRKPLAPAAIVQ